MLRSEHTMRYISRGRSNIVAIAGIFATANATFCDRALTMCAMNSTRVVSKFKLKVEWRRWGDQGGKYVGGSLAAWSGRVWTPHAPLAKNICGRKPRNRINRRNFTLPGEVGRVEDVVSASWRPRVSLKWVGTSIRFRFNICIRNSVNYQQRPQLFDIETTSS